MIILSGFQYHLEERGGILYVKTDEKLNLNCPICNAMLTEIGVRLRKVISPEGDKEVLQIRRMRCEECGKIHHELPDYLVPYKRHCAETIEKVTADNLGDVPCEPAVVHKIKAWWLAIKDYFLNILIAVAERMEIEPPEHPTFKEKIRTAANSHLWTFPGRLGGVLGGV